MSTDDLYMPADARRDAIDACENEIRELLIKIKEAACNGENSLDIENVRPAVITALQMLGYEFEWKSGYGKDVQACRIVFFRNNP